MNPVFRKILFRFLTLFFVIFVPILVFAVLGFDFNFSQKKLVNSMDITIETLPRNASITNFGKNTGKTPVSLKIEAGNSLELEIKKEDFLTEKFGFISPKDQNTNIRLSNLQLLPSQGQTIAALQEPSKNQATGSPLRENMTILPEIILWTANLPISKDQNNNIEEQNQNNSINSTKNTANSSSSNLQGAQNNSNFNSQSVPIQSTNELKPNENKTQNAEKSLENNLKQKGEQTVWTQNFTLTGLVGSSRQVSKISNRKFESGGNWQNIGKSYWNKETKWLLFTQNNNWNLIDLASLSQMKKLVQNSDLQFLVLDNSDNLWLWNLDNLENVKNSQNKTQSNSQTNSQNISNNSLQNDNNSDQKSIQTANSEFSPRTNEENQSQNSFNIEGRAAPKTDLQKLFQLEFLESSICQMAFLDKNIWIRQNTKIFRLESGKIENWNLERNFFAANSKLTTTNSSDCGKMEVKNFLQGYIFLIEQTLWFLPDSDRQSWLVLANLVDSFETFEESLFWQSGQNLYNYNSITRLEKYLGQIELQNSQKTKLLYDFNWRRLLIYTENQIEKQLDNKNTDKNNSSNNSVILVSNSQNSQTSQELKKDLKKSTNSNNSQNQVWSVWFDRLNPNSQNIIFYPKVWLENKNCLNRIQDGLQFCLENENLATYGNFNLF